MQRISIVLCAILGVPSLAVADNRSDCHTYYAPKLKDAGNPRIYNAPNAVQKLEKELAHCLQKRDSDVEFATNNDDSKDQGSAERPVSFADPRAERRAELRAQIDRTLDDLRGTATERKRRSENSALLAETKSREDKVAVQKPDKIENRTIALWNRRFDDGSSLVIELFDGKIDKGSTQAKYCKADSAYPMQAWTQAYLGGSPVLNGLGCWYVVGAAVMMEIYGTGSSKVKFETISRSSFETGVNFISWDSYR